MRILKRHTDFAIVARTFYRNVPDSALKRSCEQYEVPLVFAGAGDVFSMYSFVLHRIVQYLKILPFEKVIVADYTDTLIKGTADEFYDRLPDDGVLTSTDYQKLPYLQLNKDNPVFPVSPPEFSDCFVDKKTGLVYSPNGGAYGGNRLAVIAMLERMLAYAEHFSGAEEPGYIDDRFPFIAPLQRRLPVHLIRDDQHLANLMYYDKAQHEKAGQTFPLKIELDRDKRVFTDCQPGYTDGEAIFFHYSGVGLPDEP